MRWYMKTVLLSVLVTLAGLTATSALFALLPRLY